MRRLGLEGARTERVRLRRTLSLIVTVTAVGLLSPAAVAAPTPTPGKPNVPPAVKGAEVCSISDNRLTEISGMVAVGDGFAVINDAPDDGTAGQVRVFFLDGKCKVTSVYSDSQQPRDPEDLAISPDGTLWVADIGDNGSDGPNKRATIALWKIPPGDGAKRGKAQIYRMKYPDGAHDAEALLLNGDGTPIIVTKGGEAGIYTPTGPLTVGVEVPLRKVGTFTPVRTGTTGGFLGIVGQGLVTGGANSPDGKKVALRTYSDAYEWDVTNGDVLAALTGGTPRITPLPDEPQGESIAYSKAGDAFLTVSETTYLSNDQKPVILTYAPSSAAPVASKANGSDKQREPAAPSSLTVDDIALMIAGVGVLGLILVVVGVIGIRRSRKRAGEAQSQKMLHASKPGGSPIGVASVPAENSLGADEWGPQGEDSTGWGLPDKDSAVGSSGSGVYLSGSGVYSTGGGVHPADGGIPLPGGGAPLPGGGTHALDGRSSGRAAGRSSGRAAGRSSGRAAGRSSGRFGRSKGAVYGARSESPDTLGEERFYPQDTFSSRDASPSRDSSRDSSREPFSAGEIYSPPAHRPYSAPPGTSSPSAVPPGPTTPADPTAHNIPQGTGDDPLAFLDVPRERGSRGRASRPTAPGVSSQEAGTPRVGRLAGRARKPRAAVPADDDAGFGFADLWGDGDEPDLGLRSPKRQ